MKILDTELLGNSLYTWGVALGVALAFLLAVTVLRWVLGRQFKRMADASDSLLWDAMLAVVRRSQSLFLIIVAVFIGSIVLDLPDEAKRLITLAAVVALLIQSGIWASTALRAALGKYREQKKDVDPASVTPA